MIQVLQALPPLVSNFQRLVIAMSMIRSVREDLQGALNVLATGLLGPSQPSWPDETREGYTGGLRLGDEHHRYRWKRRRQWPQQEHMGAMGAAVNREEEEATPAPAEPRPVVPHFPCRGTP